MQGDVAERIDSVKSGQAQCGSLNPGKFQLRFQKSHDFCYGSSTSRQCSRIRSNFRIGSKAAGLDCIFSARAESCSI